MSRMSGPNCKMRQRFVWHWPWLVKMWRLAPQLLLILLLCGIIQAITANGMPSDLGGLQCSDCTQLRHLPCAVLRSVPCTDLVDSEREDVTLGVPNNVAVKRYNRIYPTAKGDITHTGINVTFRLPYGFDTPGLLQGFEIKLIGASGPIGNQQVCHRMDFSRANFTGSRQEQDTAKCHHNQGTDSLGQGDTWESGIITVTEKEMRLFFDCFPPQLEIDAVVVTTLPKFEEISSVHILSKNFEPAPDDPNLPMTADRWQPMVKLSQVSSLCELAVSFDQGPTRFHYDSYQVTIYGSRTRQIDLQNLEKQNDSLKGEYQVNVSTFVGKHSLFTAKVQPRGYIFGMESLSSNEVDLTGCSSGLPSEPNPDQALPELKPGQEHPRMSLLQAQQWSLAVGLIILFAIAWVITHLCRKWRKRECIQKSAGNPEEFNMTITGLERPVEPYPQNDSGPPNAMPGREIIQHGLVLLYYNHGRADVEHSLCRYLEHQCACTIMSSLDAPYASKDKEWLAHQLSADCELIIDSVGAVRHCKYNMIETDGLNQHKDFLAGIDHLTKRNTGMQDGNGRFFMIRFHCKYCNHDIPKVQHNVCGDHLMQDISRFFGNINGPKHISEKVDDQHEGPEHCHSIQAAEDVEAGFPIETKHNDDRLVPSTLSDTTCDYMMD